MLRAPHRREGSTEAKVEGMRLRRRKARDREAERIYEVRATEAGWRLVRQQGGYLAEFGSRAEAVERGMEICRQLAPARLYVLDARGRVVEEVKFGGRSSAVAGS